MGTHPEGGSGVGGVSCVNHNQGWGADTPGWYGWMKAVRARLNDDDKNIVIVVLGPQVCEQWGWGADRTWGVSVGMCVAERRHHHH